MTRGRPSASHTAWSLLFSPPLVRPIRRGTSPFEQAGGGAVRLEMRRVDQQPTGPACLCRQRREDPVEDPEPTPADETVVDRLVRTVFLRCVAPAQPVPDYEDDA